MCGRLEKLRHLASVRLTCRPLWYCLLQTSVSREQPPRLLQLAFRGLAAWHSQMACVRPTSIPLAKSQTDECPKCFLTQVAMEMFVFDSSNYERCNLCY